MSQMYRSYRSMDTRKMKIESGTPSAVLEASLCT